MSKFQNLSILLFGLFLRTVSPSDFPNLQFPTRSPERRFELNSEYPEVAVGAIGSIEVDILINKLSKYIERNKNGMCNSKNGICSPLLMKLNLLRDAFNKGTSEFLKTSNELVDNVRNEVNRLRTGGHSVHDSIMLNEVERIMYRMISKQKEEELNKTKDYILMYTEIDFLKCSGIFIHPRWVLSTVICCDLINNRTKIQPYGRNLIGKKKLIPEICYTHNEFSGKRNGKLLKNVFLAVADFSLIRLSNRVVTNRNFPSIMYNGVRPQTAYSCVALKKDSQVYVDSLYNCFHLRYMFYKKFNNTVHDICDLVLITKIKGLFSEIFEPGTPLFCDDVLIAVFSRYRTNHAEGYTELLWNKAFNRVLWMQRILEKNNDTLFQRFYPGVKKKANNISSILKSAIILIACSVILE